MSGNPGIGEADLRAFFHNCLSEAAVNQGVNFTSPFVLNYVTEVLVSFHDTAVLFRQQGVRVPVLADMLYEALDADFHRRVSLLRQMGDTSLMVSGYFPQALQRRAVDRDYYQKMGEIAYGHLDTIFEETDVYEELSDHFVDLSDVISEVSENTLSRDSSMQELLRLYQDTGSERILQRLRRLGILPLRGSKDG